MITKVSEFMHNLEQRLQNYCQALSPKERLISILILSGVFAVASLYITINAFYNISKPVGDTMKIEHIKQLPLQTRDSIKSLNFNPYDRR